MSKSIARHRPLTCIIARSKFSQSRQQNAAIARMQLIAFRQELCPAETQSRYSQAYTGVPVALGTPIGFSTAYI